MSLIKKRDVKDSLPERPRRNILIFKSQALTTGIKQGKNNASISVYPNPSNDGVITLSNINQFDLVRVYNVLGQEVHAVVTKENNTARLQINTPGVYVVYVNASGKVTEKKVIVGKE